MGDLGRVKYVTENYVALQGLTYIPTDLVVVGVAFLGVLDVPSKSFVYLAAALLLGVASAVFTYRSAGYYEREFGRFRPRQRPWTRQQKVFLCAGLLLGAVFLGLRNRLDEPVIGTIIGVSCGILMLSVWCTRRHRLTAYWPVLAAFVFGVGVTVYLYAPSEAWSLTVVICGLVWATAHLLDHLLLARTMKALPEEDG